MSDPLKEFQVALSKQASKSRNPALSNQWFSMIERVRLQVIDSLEQASQLQKNLNQAIEDNPSLMNSIFESTAIVQKELVHSLRLLNNVGINLERASDSVVR